MNLKQNPFSLYDFLGYFIPGAIFLYGALFLSGLCDNIFLIDQLHIKEFDFKRAELYIPFIILAYITGHALSYLSSITIEKYSVWSLGYPSKYLLGIKHGGYFDIKEKDHKIQKFTLRIILAIFVSPVTTVDIIFGQWLGFRDLYAKRLDPLLTEIIGNHIVSLVTGHAGISQPSKFGSPLESDYFRYAYHYAVENAPNHFPKIQNYVALFGFLRTITFVHIFYFWCFLIYLNMYASQISSILLNIGLSALGSVIFYLAFVKFYRRFSLEVLMALAIKY